MLALLTIVNKIGKPVGGLMNFLSLIKVLFWKSELEPGKGF